MNIEDYLIKVEVANASGRIIKEGFLHEIPLEYNDIASELRCAIYMRVGEYKTFLFKKNHGSRHLIVDFNTLYIGRRPILNENESVKNYLTQVLSDIMKNPWHKLSKEVITAIKRVRKYNGN